MNTITEAAKKFLATAETWRTDELDVKRQTLADFEKQLAEAQTKVRTLPVKIGEYRATIAHIEAQTAADIAREAVQAAQTPFVRRNCIPIIEAKADAAEKRITPCPICNHAVDSAPVSSRVRCPGCEVLLEMVLADGEVLPCEVTGGAVLEIVRPVENCGHVAADGCGHPNALTPECHDGVVCPVKAADASGYLGFRVGARPIAIPPEHREEVPMCDAGCKVMSDGWQHYRTCKYVAWMQGEDLPVEQEQTPTLLDLTKLPPGTACEATGEIAGSSGEQFSEGARFTIAYQEPQPYVGIWPTSADFDPGPSDVWLPALVPAASSRKGEKMPLAEYLASEQAREDVRELFDGDKPSLPVMSMEDLCLVRDEVGAWRSVMIWDDHQNKELTAYYRTDGDRFVVTDLGEGVRALRLKGVALLDIKPRVDAVMMAMWQEQTEFVAHFPAALIEGEIGTVNHPRADQLPDAICRVMLASLRVMEAAL